MHLCVQLFRVCGEFCFIGEDFAQEILWLFAVIGFLILEMIESDWTEDIVHKLGWCFLLALGCWCAWYIVRKSAYHTLVVIVRCLTWKWSHLNLSLSWNHLLLLRLLCLFRSFYFRLYYFFSTWQLSHPWLIVHFYNLLWLLNGFLWAADKLIILIGFSHKGVLLLVLFAVTIVH